MRKKTKTTVKIDTTKIDTTYIINMAKGGTLQVYTDKDGDISIDDELFVSPEDAVELSKVLAAIAGQKPAVHDADWGDK